MENDHTAIEIAYFASRFADSDGEDLAAMLKREWGKKRTRVVLRRLTKAEDRLAQLSAYCRRARSTIGE